VSATDPSTWRLPRLRIDADGAWFHDDEEVTHPGILANLRDGLRVDDAGHYLPIGPVRVSVEVADTPFVVLRVEPEGDGLALTLNDLSRETLAPDTLRFSDRGTPYCRVKGGRFEARLSRPAAYQLFQRVETSAEGGTASLLLGDRRYSLPGLSAEERESGPNTSA